MRRVKGWTLPLLYLLLLFGPAQVRAQTIIVGGSIVDQTWSTSGSPYRVQGDVTVPAGAFLTIDPGVAVEFAGTDAAAAGLSAARVELTVDGTLSINGTADLPVRFRAQSGTAAGTWYGIVVRELSGGSSLSHFTVEHAINGISSSAAGAALQLANGRVSASQQCGVNVLAGTPSLRGLVLTGNQYGLCLAGTGGAGVSHSSMSGNTSYGVYLTSSSAVTVSLENATIHGNGSSGIVGSGPGAGTSTLSIRNSLVTSNGAYGIVDAGGNLAVNATYNDVWGNASGAYSGVAPGTGAMSFNPRYVAPPADLRLAANSPAGCAADDNGALGAFAALGCIAHSVRGDMDGDRRADILWRNSSTGENYLYPMNGTAILPGEGYLRTVADQSWLVAGIGDFDGNGRADVLWRNASTGENYLYLMNGTAIAGEGYIRTVADQNWQVAGVGDFNGDGRADILWRNAASGQNYLYFMNGTAILPAEGYLRTVADLNWKVAAVGDFNDDGNDDILWRNAATGESYLYPMNGLAILGGEGYLRTVADLNWKVAGAGDFDGDGKADILWRNSSTGENYLYPMNGTAILGTEGYLRTVPDQSWKVQATRDYDGDGKADVLWRNASTGENYVYPLNGTTILGTEGYLRTVADVNWKVAGGPLDTPLPATGTYGISPSIQYSCAMGFVDLNVTSFVITKPASQLNVVGSPAWPTQAMAGSETGNSFSVQRTDPGAGTLTYSLSGTFAPDRMGWSGTFQFACTGSCDDCTNRQFPVTATRQ